MGSKNGNETKFIYNKIGTIHFCIERDNKKKKEAKPNERFLDHLSIS